MAYDRGLFLLLPYGHHGSAGALFHVTLVQGLARWRLCRGHVKAWLLQPVLGREMWDFFYLSHFVTYSKCHGCTWVDRSGRHTSEKECILVNGNSWAPVSHGCPVTLPGSGLPFAFFKTSGSFSEESASTLVHSIASLAHGSVKSSSMAGCVLNTCARPWAYSDEPVVIPAFREPIHKVMRT